MRQSNFKGASLLRANLTGVQAQQSLWLEANLTHAQCRSGQFDQAIFSEATLDAANFSQARLYQCVFQRSRAARCDFSDSDLTYADFCYADIAPPISARAFYAHPHAPRPPAATRWGDRSGILERDEELYAAETWSAQRQSRI